jgi:hypothetical protein
LFGTNGCSFWDLYAFRTIFEMLTIYLNATHVARALRTDAIMFVSKFATGVPFDWSHRYLHDCPSRPRQLSGLPRPVRGRPRQRKPLAGYCHLRLLHLPAACCGCGASQCVGRGDAPVRTLRAASASTPDPRRLGSPAGSRALDASDGDILAHARRTTSFAACFAVDEGLGSTSASARPNLRDARRRESARYFGCNFAGRRKRPWE